MKQSIVNRVGFVVDDAMCWVFGLRHDLHPGPIRVIFLLVFWFTFWPITLAALLFAIDEDGFADAALFFWDGKSSGTRHCIGAAKKKEIPWRVIYFGVE